MSTHLVNVSSDTFDDAKATCDDIAREVERAFNCRTFIEGDWPNYRLYTTNEAPAGAASYAKDLLAQAKENETAHRARSSRSAAERTERKREARGRVRPYGKRDV